ncbi:MAG: SAM-dependent methyltransferase [Cytophagales bacterium]|nr:SAM-dependent methyltransferase [Cytophagales bacterium]
MTKQKKGNLYLIPTPLADNSLDKVVPPQSKEIIANTKYYLAENVRSARRFISNLRLNINIELLNFSVLDKHTKAADVGRICNPLLDGMDVGVLSEAGCPGVADPGNLAVSFAHKYDVKVVPLVGPSSIFLALMASGFNGQSFVFHGYLPIDKQKRAHSLRSIEKDAFKKRQTQIFMETPYRNGQLFSDILKVCQPNTKLCIAKDITGEDEQIQAKTIREWRRSNIDLHKIPVIFLIFF